MHSDTGRIAATLAVLLLAAAGRPAVTGPPELAKEQEATLRDSANRLYTVWSARDWHAMFKLFTPDIQKCEPVADIEEELGGESGEWPVSWQLNAVRLDTDSPHHKLNADCSAKTWRIDAVAWVGMTAVFENPRGSRSTHESFEQAWLLIGGKWYWSPNEL